MRIQGIVFACGHRSTFVHGDTEDVGDICARVLARYPCCQCNPTRKPVNWLNAKAIAFLIETDRRERECPHCPDTDTICSHCLGSGLKPP